MLKLALLLALLPYFVSSDDSPIYCICNRYNNCFSCYYSSNDTIVETPEKTCCDSGYLCNATAQPEAMLYKEQVCVVARDTQHNDDHHTNKIHTLKNERIWCHCVPSRGCYQCYHTDPSRNRTQPGESTEWGFMPKESLFCCEEDVGCSADEAPTVWGDWPACERVTLRKAATFPQPNRQATLAILSGLAAILSVFGSGYIVFAVLSRWRRNHGTTTRERMLLSMSVFDIVGSVAFGLGPLPSPPHAIDMIGAMGNTATCTLQGVGIQLGLSVVPLYNGMLCIYFMLVAGYQVDERKIASSGGEILLHAIPLVYGMVTSIVGWVFRLFNPNSNVCWVQPFPYNCINHAFPCTRWPASVDYEMMFFIFCLGLFVSLPVIIVAMSVMTWKIYRARADFRRRFGNSSMTNDNQIVSVCTQAFLYVAAFLVTYLPSLVPHIVYLSPGTVSREVDFAIHSVHRFFQPLQGFWNFFIFIRPTFQRLRRRTNTTVWGTFVKALEVEATEASGSSTRGGSRSLRSITSSRGSFGLDRFRTSNSRRNVIEEPTEHEEG